MKNNSEFRQKLDDNENLNRLIYNAQLEEYKCLRAEILDRLKFQLQITNYAITIIAILFSIILTAIGKEIISRDQYYIVLLLPWIFIFFAFTYREQDFLIIKLAKYINTDLKPKIEKVHGIKKNIIFRWEDFYRGEKWSIYEILRGNSKYIFLFFPNLIFVIIFWLAVLNSENPTLKSYEILLIIIDIFLFITSFLGSKGIHNKYKEVIS